MLPNSHIHYFKKFLKDYETATNSHNFDNVEPLIDPKASYYFSEGSYSGTSEIRAAFEKTWKSIQNEVYTIKNVEWIFSSKNVSICTYQFHWQGRIDDVIQEGSGRGTNVITNINGRLSMLHEHLSTFSK